MTRTLNLDARLRAWSYRRQQLGRAATNPLDALRRVVAVYSSHPTAPLALFVRSSGATSERFAALEERREAIRLPAMRQSVFLIPADTAPRVVAATRQALEKRSRALDYAGISWEEYARLKPRVLEVTSRPVTTPVLQAAVHTDGRLMTAVRMMSFEGLVLRLGSSLRTDNLRYVATEAWLGRPLEDADPHQSRAWLAEQYLRGYGPARVVDFAWWAGMPLRDARSAFAALSLVDIGAGLLLPEDLQPGWESLEARPAGTVDALPKWDAYTMGYAPDGRRRLVDDAHLAQAYSNAGTPGKGGTSGDGLPLILRDGRAVASWSHRFVGGSMQVRVAPFAQDGSDPAVSQRTFEEIGGLLGAASVEITSE